MDYDRFELPRPPDDQRPTVHRWQGNTAPKAILVLAHGMGEHALRYARFAEALTEAGFIVYAGDHRGHGATVSAPEQLGDFGAAGWSGLVDDLAAVVRRAQSDHPGLSLVLFGHSMGSMAVQDLLTRGEVRIEAAALSGTTAVDIMARATANPEVDVFEAMNSAFAPNRTESDWLSRDEAEVDLYIADPLCGFTVSEVSSASLAEAGLSYSQPEALSRIPKTLPLYLFAGDQDPVGGNGALVDLVAQRYRDAGIERVEVKLYAGARHEVLNETNRDEVTADFLAWARAAIG